MVTAAHLAELERQHRALEAEIAEARNHPSIDNLKIVQLKRRKLLLKDEMARCSTNGAMPAIPRPGGERMSGHVHDRASTTSR